MVTVEQGHCTLAAVKRYWDTPCVGGRHNFFQRPLVTTKKIKIKIQQNHVLIDPLYVQQRDRAPNGAVLG